MECVVHVVHGRVVDGVGGHVVARRPLKGVLGDVGVVVFHACPVNICSANGSASKGHATTEGHAATTDTRGRPLPPQFDPLMGCVLGGWGLWCILLFLLTTCM